ncbi:DinB family protein [bacterium]|nr:DinB family protein [bacterium]
MFRKVDDFFKGYEYETQATQKVLGALTDESLNQRVAEGFRTLGDLAWHLVTTVPEMMNRTGLNVEGPSNEQPVPSTASEIKDAYGNVSSKLVEQIKANWNDETLLETDEMYGDTWPRGVTLGALLAHESHHRGQMTVLMRQAGLKVPGVYGPAKEEWAEHGMEAPA